MITLSDFLQNIKAGQYVKVCSRYNTTIVEKVHKVTRTQIVIQRWYSGDKPVIDRFRIADGNSIGDSYYSRSWLSTDPVMPEEITKYEANVIEAERFRKERERLNRLESWAVTKLFEAFGGQIPANKLKVQFISNDGLQTVAVEIKCEKITEQELVAALERQNPIVIKYGA